eukprot:284878-Ditylum_brightwellii.AAC.1
MHPTVNIAPYTTLIMQQTKIGWPQIRYGCWAKLWLIYQKCYHHKTNTENNSNGLGQIIRRMWEHAHNRWKEQNSILHHKDNAHNTTKENLLTCITATYNHKYAMLTQDHHPFERVLKDWPTQPVSSMKHWLRSNLPYIQFC